MSAPSFLTLADGTRLDYFLADLGDDLLIYHHGTPAAGPIGSDLLAAAAHHGFTVAELVRPGYGESTRQPDRTVADVAPLAAQLADHLGAERFVTLGWSGGGPHALATAALLPDRCVSALCLAGVAPYGVPGLDFLAGMGEDNIAEFGAALRGADDLEAFLAAAAADLHQITGEQVVDALLSLLPAVDQDYLTGEQGEEMAAELRWSVSRGIWGWFDDDVAFCQPWGFDLAQIRVPVQVWQGSEDLMVPFAHGEWLAQAIPAAQPALRQGHGHLSVSTLAFSDGLRQLRDDLGT